MANSVNFLLHVVFLQKISPFLKCFQDNKKEVDDSFRKKSCLCVSTDSCVCKMLTTTTCIIQRQNFCTVAMDIQTVSKVFARS